MIRFTYRQRLFGAFLFLGGTLLIATCPGGPLVGAIIVVPTYTGAFWIIVRKIGWGQ